MAGKPKRYTPEFKEQAARKVVDNSLSRSPRWRENSDVNETTLGFWVKAYRKKMAGQPLPAGMPDARAAAGTRAPEPRAGNGKRVPEKSGSVLREGASVTQKYAFIDAEYASPRRETRRCSRRSCRCAGGSDVSKSGYYEWRSRPESAAAQRRELLKIKIKALFEANNEEYGYRRMHAGPGPRRRAGRRRAGPQLMRELGLEPCQPRPWRHSLTEQGAGRADPGPGEPRLHRGEARRENGRGYNVYLRRGKAGFISPWSSTARPGKSSGGRWMIITRRRLSRARSRWRPGTSDLPEGAIFHSVTAEVITRRPSTPGSWRSWGYGSRWAGPGSAMTMLWPNR